jgi:hypothetical protein
MSEDFEEKRKAKRYAYPCEVEFYGTGHGRVAGRITVISVRGAFVETAVVNEPVGARLTLRFVLPTGPMVLTAEIAHAEARGIGVHFLAMTRAQRAAFDRVLGEDEAGKNESRP